MGTIVRLFYDWVFEETGRPLTIDNCCPLLTRSGHHVIPQLSLGRLEIYGLERIENYIEVSK